MTHDHILYDSIHMKCLEQRNLEEQKPGEWLPRTKRKERNVRNNNKIALTIFK